MNPVVVVNHICSGVVLYNGVLTCAYCAVALVRADATGMCRCKCYVCGNGRYAGCACSATNYQCIDVLRVIPRDAPRPQFFFPSAEERAAFMHVFVQQKRQFRAVYARLPAIVKRRIYLMSAAKSTGRPVTEALAAPARQARESCR